MTRALSVFCLVALTAFAPAPLPRRQARPSGDLDVGRLVGRWRITGVYYLPDKVSQVASAERNSPITITATQWSFGKERRPTYDLRIDHNKRPAEIDFMQVGQKEPHGRGLIRREGRVLRVVYNWGGARPTHFD